MSAAVAKRILLLGLGNDVRSDDVVGLMVVREVEKLCKVEGLEVAESPEMGLALLDYVIGPNHGADSGYDDLILVDSIQTGKHQPGTVIELEEKDLKILPTGKSPHYVGIPEVMAMGREMNLPMPKRFKIFAIEVRDPFSISTDVCPDVMRAVPVAAKNVIRYISDC
jgi:hydrogenase maturation protease